MRWYMTCLQTRAKLILSCREDQLDSPALT